MTARRVQPAGCLQGQRLVLQGVFRVLLEQFLCQVVIIGRIHPFLFVVHAHNEGLAQVQMKLQHRAPSVTQEMDHLMDMHNFWLHLAGEFACNVTRALIPNQFQLIVTVV